MLFSTDIFKMREKWKRTWERTQTWIEWVWSHIWHHWEHNKPIRLVTACLTSETLQRDWTYMILASRLRELYGQMWTCVCVGGGAVDTSHKHWHRTILFISNFFLGGVQSCRIAGKGRHPAIVLWHGGQMVANEGWEIHLYWDILAVGPTWARIKWTVHMLKKKKFYHFALTDQSELTKISLGAQRGDTVYILVARKMTDLVVYILHF